MAGYWARDAQPIKRGPLANNDALYYFQYRKLFSNIILIFTIRKTINFTITCVYLFTSRSHTLIVFNDKACGSLFSKSLISALQQLSSEYVSTQIVRLVDLLDPQRAVHHR